MKLEKNVQVVGNGRILGNVDITIWESVKEALDKEGEETILSALNSAWRGRTQQNFRNSILGGMTLKAMNLEAASKMFGETELIKRLASTPEELRKVEIDKWTSSYVEKLKGEQKSRLESLPKAEEE